MNKHNPVDKLQSEIEDLVKFVEAINESMVFADKDIKQTVKDIKQTIDVTNIILKTANKADELLPNKDDKEVEIEVQALIKRASRATLGERSESDLINNLEKLPSDNLKTLDNLEKLINSIDKKTRK